MEPQMNAEELLVDGENIYKLLLEKSDCQFIICPASLGDTLLAGVYLSAFKRYRNIEKVAFIIKGHHKNLISMFPIEISYLEVSEYEMWSLRVYIAANDLYDANNVLIAHFPVTGLDFSRYRRDRLLNFFDEFKAYVYKIPLDTAADSLLMPDIPLNNEYKDAVLLLPYCSGTWKCEDSFWQKIIDYYKESGRRVFTNVGNPTDKTLPGTDECSIQVSELYAQSAQFHKIIGVRSGIFDILAMRSDIELNVITSDLESFFYGKCEIDLNRHPLYFGLKYLNPKANVREFSYCKGYEEELFKEIINE